MFSNAGKDKNKNGKINGNKRVLNPESTEFKTELEKLIRYNDHRNRIGYVSIIFYYFHGNIRLSDEMVLLLLNFNIIWVGRSFDAKLFPSLLHHDYYVVHDSLSSV